MPRTIRHIAQIDVVVDVLLSSHVTQGPRLHQLMHVLYLFLSSLISAILNCPRLRVLCRVDPLLQCFDTRFPHLAGGLQALHAHSVVFHGVCVFTSAHFEVLITIKSHVLSVLASFFSSLALFVLRNRL